MLKIITGLFFILHGMVHLFYFGKSTRFLKLGEITKWPGSSWVLPIFIKKRAVRLMASNFCILSALGFIVGGIALFASHSNWYNLIVGSAVFSTLLFILFWDGKFEKLDNKGIFAVLINTAIFVLLVFVHWPVIR